MDTGTDDALPAQRRIEQADAVAGNPAHAGRGEDQADRGQGQPDQASPNSRGRRVSAHLVTSRIGDSPA